MAYIRRCHDHITLPDHVSLLLPLDILLHQVLTRFGIRMVMPEITTVRFEYKIVIVLPDSSARRHRHPRSILRRSFASAGKSMSGTLFTSLELELQGQKLLRATDMNTFRIEDASSSILGSALNGFISGASTVPNETGSCALG